MLLLYRGGGEKARGEGAEGAAGGDGVASCGGGGGRRRPVRLSELLVEEVSDRGEGNEADETRVGIEDDEDCDPGGEGEGEPE